MRLNDSEEIEDLFYGSDYTQVTDECITDTSRWSNYVEQVFQHKGSGKYYRANWEVGATEYQDVDMEVTLTEVEPFLAQVTKYREVTNNEV